MKDCVFHTFRDLAKLFRLLVVSHLAREQAGGDGRSHLSTVYTFFLDL